MAESSVSLKLLIDTHAKRVLFAEVDKDCVDFLFHVLSLPLAKLIDLVGKQETVGSLGNLYESLEKLNESNVQTKKSKDAILKPVISSIFAVPPVPPLLSLNNAPNTSKKFYTCLKRCYIVADDSKTPCPTCCRTMNVLIPHVSRSPIKKKPCEECGFVKGMVTYMVMDDLVVKPMSTISSLTLLNEFNVKEVGALQEKVVHLGMSEAVKLLKASLETDKVLTNVFLNRKKRTSHVC